jgi:hypothetical protein
VVVVKAAAGFAGEVFGDEFVAVVEVVGTAVAGTLLSLLLLLLLFGEDGLEAVTLVAVPVDDGVVLVDVGDGSSESIFVSSVVCVMSEIIP